MPVRGARHWKTQSKRRLKRREKIQAEEDRKAPKRVFSLGEETIYGRVAALGMTLTMSNGGKHWLFRGDSLFAEWWPKNGRLVLNRNYAEATFTSDIEEVLRVILDHRPRHG